MAIYKVTSNQNIWDVSLHLCGSIEGVFDLLISNPFLSLNTELIPGMELEYHDYFVINEGIASELKNNKLVPANGERHVYYKPVNEELKFMYFVPSDAGSISFSVSGEGDMIVDWGDNSKLETITLTHVVQHVNHNFNNVVDERRVKVYGNFTMMRFDASAVKGDLYTIHPTVVDEFVSRENDNNLQGLFLFEGTVRVDLQSMEISDLMPIRDMNLQELNLSHVKFSSVSVLDDYLVYIAENYGNRRNCVIYLNTEPSERGMNAIQTIINEPEWNYAGKWQFVINDTIYTKQ